MSNLQIYRDFELEASQESDSGTTTASSTSKVVFLQTKEYVPYDGALGNGLRRTTTLFSTFPPDELLMMLTSSFDESNQEYHIKQPTWKIVFTVRKQISTEQAYYEHASM